MPLYDCVMLLKPHVQKESAIDLIARVGKHVYARNGVITEIKTFETIELGYGIKKLDGRYFQGQLMQMTMMATPNINKELHYLNKEDRLLRWLLVKHRETKYGRKYGYYINESSSTPRRFGLKYLADELEKGDLGRLSQSSRSVDKDDSDDNNYDEDDFDEYEEKADEPDADKLDA